MKQRFKPQIKAISAVLALCVGTAAFAETDAGPDVGEAIPAPFEAVNSAGETVAYSDITGPNGTVLAFVRSASWCPYCQAQLIDLQTIAGALEERGYTLAALSYDAPGVWADFQAKHDITYTMLSDDGSVMIDAFELRDPQYGEGSMANGVPRPAILVIDGSGTVQAKLAEEGYKIRPTTEAVLAAVDGVAATQ